MKQHGFVAVVWVLEQDEILRQEWRSSEWQRFFGGVRVQSVLLGSFAPLGH